MIKIKRYESRHIRKGRFPARYLALCGCALVLLVAVSTGITTSKMRSDAAASDGARAAKFEVTAESADNNKDFVLAPDDPTCTYAFTVTSKSEVTVTYDVIVTLPQALPDGVHMTLDGKSAQATDGNTYTFSQAGVLKTDSAGNTCSHELVFTAEEGMTGDSTLPGIIVIVRAEQVD